MKTSKKTKKAPAKKRAYTRRSDYWNTVGKKQPTKKERVAALKGKYKGKIAPPEQLPLALDAKPRYIILGPYSSEAKDYAHVQIDGAHGMRVCAPNGDHIDVTWDSQTRSFKLMASDTLLVAPRASNVIHLNVVKPYQEKQK